MFYLCYGNKWDILEGHNFKMKGVNYGFRYVS